MYEDEEQEEMLDKPFYCPNCGGGLGWYEICECDE